MGSEYRPSSFDGLPARVSGPWAEAKLEYVRRYMDIFSNGMKLKWRYRVYVDLLAGCGRCVLDDGGREFPGSPLISLEPKSNFTHRVFVEGIPQLAEALERRTRGTGAVVVAGDSNSTKTLNEVLSLCPAAALGLTFVDMLGCDIEMAALRTLTTDRNMDLLITFQTSDLVRNCERALSVPSEGERLDLFFGDAGWRPLVRGTGQQRGEALESFYYGRLATLGYVHVQPLHRFMKNRRNARLYRLVLAARHQLAVDFFRRIAKYDFHGQPSMF